MVLLSRNNDMDDTMPQTVPSAGFTPPCDYSNFADNFDLSLLPGGELPLSPSTLLYTQSPPPMSCQKQPQPKIYTTFYPDSPKNPDNNELDLGPDFQKLLVPQEQAKKQNNVVVPGSPLQGIYLEVPSAKNYHANSPAGALSPYSPQGLVSPNDQFALFHSPASDHHSLYPSSPDVSLYTQSPNSAYSRSPCDEFIQSPYIKSEYPTSPLPSYSSFKVKEENYLSPCSLLSSPSSPSPSYSNQSSPDQVGIVPDTPDVLNLLGSASTLDRQIKQESTVDFGSILQGFQDTESLRELLDDSYRKDKDEAVSEKPKDHQLLREVLRDTSFQKKYNIKTFDFGLIAQDIKMEEPEEANQSEMMSQEQIAREHIEPVLNMAIEQMRKDVENTCAALGLSRDPVQWTSANVLSWIQWTSRQFGLPVPTHTQWSITGAQLMTLSEEDFSRRAPQGGMILHAQLEIWKAAYADESMQWMPETASSNASSGDMSDEEEEDNSATVDPAKPSTSRTTGSSHIHLWQFLKELLASPQMHGSCIRWLDRSKGIFKIEDSVKVARLWGKRKNRPAMNYDKLSRSIRQYYKKGIMKKTERSQRLVYQFCHPYNL